jgi:hypothetical protein
MRRIWAQHVTLTGEMRNAYTIFAGKAEWKKPLGKPRLRWEIRLSWILKK